MLQLIYALTDPRTGTVRYVGITHGSLEARLLEHRSQAHRGSPYPVHRWLRKLARLGLEPGSLILERSADRLRECYWIAHYGALGQDLLNCTQGGEGTPGFRHSEATRQRISAIQMGKPGRKWTEEQRQRLSEANTGRRLSAETRAKISAVQTGKKRPCSEARREKVRATLTGRKRPPEVVAKVAASLKGKKPNRVYGPLSAETKAKLAAAKTGRKHTPEHAAKVRASLTGKKRTPEQCARISAGKKGRPLSTAHVLAMKANPPAARLGPDEVRSIRELARMGGLTQAQIAARFGVARSTVADILCGRTWSHVE